MLEVSPSLNNLVSTKQLQRIRILAVDDEADSLSLLAFILEQREQRLKLQYKQKKRLQPYLNRPSIFYLAILECLKSMAMN